ncbi:helix-turn-helix domain-containing protein [Nesterenkonia muleiensis]|uniref:helix-turn-helix domain-containing protein n=1 Tax=Nesterenkonia muleiensis TaxID=2282648 RepID=UPI001EE418DE|nr:helix-turn-helix domain-containing protein [Nesterenkonia muleiensis]
MGKPPQIPVEKKTRILLSVLAGEITITETARREKISAQSIGRWKAAFLEEILDALELIQRAEYYREGCNTIRPHEAIAWNRPMGWAQPTRQCPPLIKKKSCHKLDVGHQKPQGQPELLWHPPRTSDRGDPSTQLLPLLPTSRTNLTKYY